MSARVAEMSAHAADLLHEGLTLNFVYRPSTRSSRTQRYQLAEFAGSAAGSVVVPPWAAILGEAEPASGDEAVELVFDSPRERMEIGPQPVAREVLMLLPLELLRQDARDGGQKDERLYLVDHVRDLPESGKRNHSRVRLIRSTVFRHRSGCTWVSAG